MSSADRWRGGPRRGIAGAALAMVLAAACLLLVVRARGGTAAGELSRPAPAAPPAYAAAIQEARAVLDETMRAGHVGLAVAVGVDGDIVWSEGFGWADVELRAPVTATSRFRIGSVSKPLTAAGVALLHTEGRLDLDAPIQTYVPGFPVKAHRITTRLLGGHLAGIRHYAGGEFLSTRHYASVAEGLEIFANDALMFEPGTAYSYSSYGWNLISAVIEGASGEDFLAFMGRRVFGPLGMQSTGADFNSRLVPGRVSFYERDDSGEVLNSPYVDNSYKWAGGGFLSTMDDLVRFGSAHLEPGFLPASALELLFTSQTTSNGDATGYGLGWRVGSDEDLGRIVSHSGGSVGGSTALVVYRDAGVVVAMASNMSNAPRIPIHDVARLFIE